MSKNILQTKKNTRLQENLVLFSYLKSQLGLDKSSDIQKFKDTVEGIDMTSNHSYMYHQITSSLRYRIPTDKLMQYDDNIIEYMKKLSRKRSKPIWLKYFQYLAVLLYEIYLDKYFDNPNKLINELNEYLEQNFPTLQFDPYSRSNLKKIAVWMATGSGKTFLIHVNFWQFKKYNKGENRIEFDNVILVTQSNELSEQHFNELSDSGIPAVIFRDGNIGYFEDVKDQDLFKIINIHKLKFPGEKKEQGVSVDISSFGSKNLLFVDEGHKGYSSDGRKWKQIRKEISKNGFTLEYSATYGQAINGSSDEDFNEYAKSIIFDYSYKYFFMDGYGKDFRVLNLDKFSEDMIDTVLLSNAIAFYEQKKVYLSNLNEFFEYNIANPLWIFVGHKVQEEASDILRILKFFIRVVNDRKWAERTIHKIITGKSGLLDKKGDDIFKPTIPELNFSWLREKGVKDNEIFNGILDLIFNFTEPFENAILRLTNVKLTDGEIAIRIGDSRPFAVINIGNKSEFLSLVRTKLQEVIVEDDQFGRSYFEQIERPTSTTNILIGAKKFIEGWNSYRVSCMGLLNIGRKEGSQVIQLFGRGVRLKGKDGTLKRSSFIRDDSHPKYIQVLETLNIFGIKASYMDVFREIIGKEEILYEEIKFESKPFSPFPNDLRIPLLKKSLNDFKNEIIVSIDSSTQLSVKIDLLPRVNVIDSRPDTVLNRFDPISDSKKIIDSKILLLLDWDDIFLTMLSYKKEKGWNNIIMTKENLQNVIFTNRYHILCDEDVLRPSNFVALEKIKEIVILILKKYTETVYLIKKKGWEKRNLGLKTIKEEDEIVRRSYSIKVTNKDISIVDEIRNSVLSGDVYSDWTSTSLKNIYFDRHLYQPLLMITGNIIVSPGSLNEGEILFIQDLKKYLSNTNGTNQNKTIFLLRNLTRGKGIGFFETHGFYPDFILWLKDGSHQNIVFIDPKGLVYLEGINHPKLQLYKFLKELTSQLQINDITLNSFIISVTPFETIKQLSLFSSVSLEEFERNHVLFQYISNKYIRNTDYIKRMFEIIQNRK